MPWNAIQPWKRRQPTHASTRTGLKHIMVSAIGRHRKTSVVWFHLQSEPGRDRGRTVTARPAWRGWGATVHQAQRFNPGRGESSGDGWWVCRKAMWAYAMPANATHRNTKVINFRLYTLDYNKKGALKTEHSVHICTGTYLFLFLYKSYMPDHNSCPLWRVRWQRNSSQHLTFHCVPLICSDLC